MSIASLSPSARPLPAALIAAALVGCLPDSAPLVDPLDARPPDAAPDAHPLDRGALDGPPDVPDAAPDLAPPDLAPPDLAPFDAAPDLARPADLAVPPDAAPALPMACGWRVHPVPPGGGTLRFDEPARDPAPPQPCRDDIDDGRVLHLTLDAPTRIGVHAPSGYGVSVQRGCDPETITCGPVLGQFDLDAGEHLITVLGDPASIEVELDPPPVDLRICANDLDDDGDGLVDLDDPGCIGPHGLSELDPPRAPACANGLDDDGDGATDHPADPECAAAGGQSEVTCGPPGTVTGGGAPPTRFDALLPVDGPSCHGEPDPTRGVVHRRFDRLTVVAWRDRAPRVEAGHTPSIETSIYRGCALNGPPIVECSPGDAPVLLEPGDYLFTFEPGERLDAPAAVQFDEAPLGPCANGLDDDGDGLIDLADPGCVGPADAFEGEPADAPACHNGIDDDGDGLVDWPLDPHCLGTGARSEGADCAGVYATVGDEGGRVSWDHAPPNDRVGGCPHAGGEGVVVTVDLERPARVLVEGRQTANWPVHARADCDDPDSERYCLSDGGLSPLLPPGRWHLFVEPERRMWSRDRWLDVTVAPATACADGLDDDGDGLVDAADPGCAFALDESEVDPPAPPSCANGVDDDGDGLVDHPADPECARPASPSEARRCRDLPVIEGVPGIAVYDPPFIEREQGLCGFQGPVRTFAMAVEGVWGAEAPRGERVCAFTGCARERVDIGALAFDSGFVVFEHPLDADPRPVGARRVAGPRAACEDEVDNDDDGLVDLDDPGCAQARDFDEHDPPAPPACANGRDDDGDGVIDHPDDPGCVAAGDDDERGVCPHTAPLGPPITTPGEARVVRLVPDGIRYPTPCVERPGLFDATGSLDGYVELVLDRPARLDARTRHSTFDPVLSLRAGCALNDERSWCDADSGPGPEARLQVDRLEPGRYALIVREVSLPHAPFEGVLGGLSMWAAETLLDVRLTPLDE